MLQTELWTMLFWNSPHPHRQKIKPFASFSITVQIKNVFSWEVKMIEHHSQEALNSQDYPHCRQAALCSIDAIFSKWCNSCKGSPRTFNLWAQAILKRVSRDLISLHCHLPILCTNLLPTQVIPFKVSSSKKETDSACEEKICIYTLVSKHTCPAVYMTRKLHNTLQRFSDLLVFHWNTKQLGFLAEFVWRLWKAHSANTSNPSPSCFHSWRSF